MDSEAWLCLMLRRFLFSVLLLALHKGVDGLKFISLNVPHHALTGQSVTLECIYEMEGDDLYSVKWYKDTNEFYRFIPQDSPPKQIFALPGITVDQNSSSAETVRLVNVGLNSSGIYKCEISAEAPNFDTESRFAEMTVYDVPDGGAQIQGLKQKYDIGDTVNVNCTAKRSKPAAHLEWHINGDKASSEILHKYNTIIESDGLETSVLGLEFKVEAHHLINGELRLNCTAAIGYVYQDVAFFHTYQGDHSRASLLESKGNPSQGKSSCKIASDVKSANVAPTTMRSLIWYIVSAVALLLR